MTWDPRGRIAVVTGASSGIGEATTRRLARCGMTVVAVARREDRLEALAEGQRGVIPFVADVTDTDSVDALAKQVRQDFGACHALVNNAGVRGGEFRGREDLDRAIHTIDVNLVGTVRCTAAFADLLEAGAPSRVVNIASVAGKLGLGSAGYTASKFGVVGFSETLGFAWASRDITVCQLNPGFVHTEGFPQDHFLRSPVGRLVGTPDDVARAVHDVLVSGDMERTVPRWYRGAIVARHVSGPVYRMVARRLRRASGRRD